MSILSVLTCSLTGCPHSEGTEVTKILNISCTILDAAPSTSKPSLLTLPMEIRLQIWKAAVPSEKEVLVCECLSEAKSTGCLHRWRSCHCRFDDTPALTSPLLLSNRQIYAEARPFWIPSAQKTFVFCSTACLDAKLASLTLRERNCIQCIRFDVEMGSSIGRSAKALKTSRDMKMKRVATVVLGWYLIIGQSFRCFSRKDGKEMLRITFVLGDAHEFYFEKYALQNPFVGRSAARSQVFR